MLCRKPTGLPPVNRDFQALYVYLVYLLLSLSCCLAHNLRGPPVIVIAILKIYFFSLRKNNFKKLKQKKSFTAREIFGVQSICKQPRKQFVPSLCSLQPHQRHKRLFGMFAANLRELKKMIVPSHYNLCEAH